MKTKKGMASLYLVAFTTLLLGIVTMSFTSIMINERKEASNSDLSQSAFDSALAGIEDAKTAILMYETCSGTNAPTSITVNKGTRNCAAISAAMSEGLKKNDCDTIQKVISGDKNKTGEVKISEDLDQAYTCVPISEASPTYQSTLTENTRSRVVNAGDKIVKEEGGAGYADIVGIELQWYTSETELGLDPDLKYMEADIDSNGGLNIRPLGTKNQATGSYPIVNFELFQTDEQYTMAELDLNNASNTGTDHAMITLYPEEGAKVINDDKDPDGKGTFVSAKDLLDASNKSNTAAQENSVVPKPVSCDYESGAHCRATIQLPATYRGGTTEYGKTVTKNVEADWSYDGNLCGGSPNPTISDGVRPGVDQNLLWAMYRPDHKPSIYRILIDRLELSPELLRHIGPWGDLYYVNSPNGNNTDKYNENWGKIKPELEKLCREKYQSTTEQQIASPRAQSTFLFRVSLPYGAPETDFSIKPCTKMDENGKCTEYAHFNGAQYIVDSTGRASTLYRRIIARIETSTNFIFPEYAVQTSGDNSMIEKNFWVTENCWATDGKGNSAKCANNGNASTAFPQGSK